MVQTWDLIGSEEQGTRMEVRPKDVTTQGHPIHTVCRTVFALALN